MRVLFCSAVVLLIAAVSAVDPGLKFRVSHEALNYGAQEAMNVASTLLLDQDIPAFKGESDLTLGNIKYNLDQLRITGFQQGTADVHLNEEEGVLDVRGIGLSLKGKWQYNYKLAFIPISDSGSFDLRASGGDLKLGVTLGMGSDGKLTLSTTQCQGGINNLDVTFQGGASWLYNLFRSVIANSIKDVLNDMLCEGIESAIEDYLSPVLEDLALEFPIANIGTLDFHFTESPASNQETVETYHKGEFFWAGDRTEAPFSPDPLPEPDQELRMITVWMSDYVINSLFYVLHKHDLTHLVIGASDPDIPSTDQTVPKLKNAVDYPYNNQPARQNDSNDEDITLMLPEAQRGLFNMTCPGSACFGSILPPEIADQFPDSTVSVEGWTNAQPELEVNAKGVHAKMEARLDFTAVKPNGETFMLFSTITKFDASLFGEMDGSKLKFSVKSISPKITLLESNVEGISGSLLTLIFRLAINGGLKPLINELGEQGIPIPDFDILEYVNPYLMLTDNTIIMMLDVAYSPKYAKNILQYGRVGRTKPHLFLN